MQPQGNLSYFINVMSIILKKFNDIQSVFFITYILLLILLFWSVAKLSYSIFQREGVVFLIFLLSLHPIGVSGTGIGTYELYLIPRSFGIPLSFLSLYFFMEDRYILSSFLLSITFLLHALTPVSPIISLFLYLLIKGKFKIFYKFLLTFLLISSPLFYKFLLNYNHISLSSFFENSKHIYYILRYCAMQNRYFPLEWDFHSWLALGIFILLFLTSIFIKNRKYGLTSKEEKSFIIILSSLFLLIINIIFGELIPISIIMQFQLARSIVFIYWLSIIYFAFLLWVLLNAKSYISKLVGFTIVINILHIFLFKSLSAWLTYTLSWITALFIASKFPDMSNFLEQRRVKIIISVLTIIFLIYPLFRISNDLHTATIQYPHHYLSTLNKKDKAWIYAQLWAKDHTKINAVFVAPSYPPFYARPTFRVFSERTIIFTPEDEGPITMSYKYAKEWYRRWKDFKNYDKLSPNGLVNLAKKYNADYIVVENNKKLNLPLVYKNDYFKIYKYK